MADGPYAGDDNVAVGSQDSVIEAVVTFGEISPDDQEGVYDIEDDSGVWTDCYVVNRYEGDKHIWMSGVTSPGGFNSNSVSFYQMATETLMLISDWTIERMGSPPERPSADPTDDNMILLDKHVEPTIKITLADGVTQLYRVHGTFVYGFKNPDQASYCWPTPPWVEDGTGECDLSDGDEVDGIICCGSGGGGSGDSPGNPGSQNSPSDPSQVGSFPKQN